MLYDNQKKAINFTINNDFTSGVHCHATGTGKSWIGLEIMLEFNKKYPKKHIMWLCEHKSILIEQFDKKTLKERGYENIYNIFNIKEYTINKPEKWYREVNAIKNMEKPILLLINRAFLVSKKKYEKIKCDFGLIIHDECHSIINKTTQEFYNYILDKTPNLSCIGLTATPELSIKPYDKVLTSYSIYDAFKDDVILPAKIKWVECDNILENEDIISIIKNEIEKLYYKKIVIWCGMISHCYDMASLWKKEFPNFLIAVDTSISKEDIEKKEDLKTFEEFNVSESNSILFCAGKHREGSDIMNLDACIFLDKVEDRNAKTFVQCIGRVLRKDKNNNKKYGLIIDLKASNCLNICDRVNSYLNYNTEKNITFPWKYEYKNSAINNKNIILNELKMIKKNNEENKDKYQEYTIKDIKKRFIIDCPNDARYILRLEKEFKMIKEKKLELYLIRATEILKLIKYIPHVTRGSCGSSLVCYLLGISNVDPIKYDIKFERFLNEYRDNLPDIDFDFPHYLRDEVFLKLELKWENQVARISNHVNWHEKSATREALRRIGYKKMIPKEELHKFIKSLPKEEKEELELIKNDLNDTFRHYSLHCGGIVFFHDGIPKDLVLPNSAKTLTQIIYDKNDVAEKKNFKIDILSSRAISQLMGICGENIDFTDCEFDEKTYNMLQSGKNIGITLAESPLMRKAMLKIQPKNISDLAKCLAIIRPAAKDARLCNNEIDFNTKFVFDDDAITMLAENLNISLDLADKFRRCISKGVWDEKLEKKYNKLLQSINSETRDTLTKELENLRYYSFCKSHSYSYAQLIYKLAYEKAHNPKKFWESTLKNASSSYRKWVHIYEARLAGVNVMETLNKSKDISIYAINRREKFDGLSKEEQLRRFGYWDMKTTEFFPNCYFYEKEKGVYYFCGIIASMRILNYGKKPNMVIFLCVGPNRYIEIFTKEVYCKPNSIGLKGRANLTDAKQNIYNAFIARFY